ncbi:DNA repair protein RecO [Leptospira gomenensis]|uniref:DNA repair protein RecO n=1 Tax=Leptospira gomenensis TaxID=2484974 RepID=A0A5F1YRF6_9LEPT|nr:DNA repair protein RecO [Leptospira gomenensis]TGK30887.1 DNA repair protein RecO [Leptospira gomenensis]TGK32525.1 DNA repair protein RecO [Leptospira gomenensis]TGK45393.1 DNA repair protein RecO [Leptospira gomenensis]TGK60615.1 DNA repair protein RecO [Leptospira gomenensis]
MSGNSNGSLRKIRGIVLESRSILDGDALVRLLPEAGQVENFRVRGIRKSKTRAIASVEPGSLSDVDYYHSKIKETHNVKEISLINRFDKAKSGYFGTVLVSYLVELASAFTPDGAEHPGEFRLLYGALEELEENGPSALILPFFKLRLLVAGGFLSKELLCHSCGTELKEMTSVTLQTSPLEIVCGNCLHGDRNDLGTAQWIQTFLVLRFRDLKERKISVENILDLDRICNGILEPILRKKLKSALTLYEALGENLGKFS